MADVDFYLHAGDTAPPLTAQIQQESGAPFPIPSGATVDLRLWTSAGELFVTERVVIDDAPNGRVSYTWKTSDTYQAGTFRFDFRVNLLDGTVRTVPNTGSLHLRITG